eukprot:m.67271 g.67271  ORF g.67271 m.67271 type:complete len:668 (+) comp12700_c0_seq1:42-2045(+)
MGLDGSDGAVIAVYFITLAAIGFRDVWLPALRRALRRHERVERADGEGTPQSYFLASREMNAWAVGASLFASNIGSEHFVGLAGTAASSGMGVGWFEWTAPFYLALLGWVFVPLYLRNHVFTMPEYMQKRFGGQRIRLAISLVSLGLYVFTKVSASLYAGGVIFHTVLDVNPYLVAVALILITGSYTALGGLRVVVHTEVFNTIMLLAGGLVVCALSLNAVGGLEDLKQNKNIPSSFFHMARSPSDEEFPWPGMVFGIWCSSVWYWCADQNIVQRVLCARTETTARWGTVLASALKVLPVFMMVLPGIAARALYPSEIADRGPDAAYPLLVTRLLPHGLLGLVCASMLSALMSSLASVFNSASTLLTMDVWQRFRPNTPPRTLVTVGRIATAIMCVLSLLWLPLVARGSSLLFIYVQRVSNYLSPPITTCFLLSLWPAAEEPSVFAALVVGLLFGFVRLLLDIAAGDTPTFWLASINFMYFALISATLTALIAVGGSLYSRHTRKNKTHFSARYRPAPGSSDMVDEFDDTLELVASGRLVTTIDPDPEQSSSLLPSAGEPALMREVSEARDGRDQQDQQQDEGGEGEEEENQHAHGGVTSHPHPHPPLPTQPSSQSLSSTTSETIELPSTAESHWHVVRAACRAAPGQAVSSMAVCATMVFLLAYFA